MKLMAYLRSEIAQPCQATSDYGEQRTILYGAPSSLRFPAFSGNRRRNPHKLFLGCYRCRHGHSSNWRRHLGCRRMYTLLASRTGICSWKLCTTTSVLEVQITSMGLSFLTASRAAMWAAVAAPTRVRTMMLPNAVNCTNE